MEPKEEPVEGRIDPAPGLAGGPGPTPPGLEDGTAVPRGGVPETTDAAAQQGEGEAAERSAGVRRADVPGLAGEREGGAPPTDPRVEEQERRTRR
jgi:hypothetical protein